MSRAAWRYLPFLAVLLSSLAGGGAQAAAGDRNDVLGVVFSEVERRIIRDYYGLGPDHRDNGPGKKERGKGVAGSMPAGLAKRGELPPGLARKLEQDGTLPPGLTKRDLPADLLRRLPDRRDGRRRVIVDGDVVLIEEATGLVLDVIEGVLRDAAR